MSVVSIKQTHRKKEKSRHANYKPKTMDGGTCSKVINNLPALLSFLSKIRSSLTGLKGQVSSNTRLVQQLQQAQASVGNGTHVINSWMRQASAQMDKLNTEIGMGNDSLTTSAVAMATSSQSSSESPGVPNAITLVPGTAVNQLLLYFVRPSYSGSTPISGYEIAVFRTLANALSWSGLTETITLTDDPPTPPFNHNSNDMYSIYGSDLRVVYNHIALQSAQGSVVRVRASNTSGTNGDTLWSSWSAASMLCVPATNVDQLKPAIEDVIPGANFSQVSWRVPMIQQPDQSWAIVGGIYSYMIASHMVMGGSTSTAQIPLVSTDTSITVEAMSHDGIAAVQFSISDPFSVVIPLVVSTPHINVRLIQDKDGTYAMVYCTLVDYNADTTIKYNVSDTEHTITNAIVGQDSSDLDEGTSANVRMPLNGYLKPGQTYFFEAFAEHAVIGDDSVDPKQSSVSPTAGPFHIPEQDAVILFSNVPTDLNPLVRLISSRQDSLDVLVVQKTGDTSFKMYITSPYDDGPDVRWPVQSELARGLFEDSDIDVDSIVFNNGDVHVGFVDSTNTPYVFSTMWESPITQPVPIGTQTVSGRMSFVFGDIAVPIHGMDLGPKIIVCSVFDLGQDESPWNVLPPVDWPIENKYVAVTSCIVNLNEQDNSTRVLLALTSGGSVHIWFEGSGEGQPGTPTFILTDMSSPSTTARNTRMAITPDGNTLVVYNGVDHTIRTARRTETTWIKTSSDFVDLNRISQCPHDLCLDVTGMSLLALDYVDCVNNTGVLRYTLYAFNTATNTWSIVSEDTGNESLTMIMTNDGQHFLSYDTKHSSPSQMRIGILNQ